MLIFNHQDCPMGCKQCNHPICKSKLALIIYNLGIGQTQFKPLLYDFQGILKYQIEKKTYEKFRPRNKFQFRSRKRCDCRVQFLWSLAKWRILYYRWNISIYNWKWTLLLCCYKDGKNQTSILNCHWQEYYIFDLQK